MSLLKHELPYVADGAALFAHVADRPWAVYLDSGQPASQYGHYDIIVAEPVMTLVTQNDRTTIIGPEGEQVSTDDPFLLLKQALAAYAIRPNEHTDDLPFCGGALGYFGYDGNSDTCIMLRTALLKDGQIHIQAGAGVVADSVPTSEYQETISKAAALFKAVAMAEQL